MTFEQLFAGIKYKGNLPQGDVSLVTQDSRKVVLGAVFVCVVGRTSDGHAFASKALESGAKVIVSETATGFVGEVVVEDARLAYALLCRNFFANPAEKLKLIAVTGTNGKTTVSSVLKQTLQELGHPCGLIGTIQCEIGDMVIPAKFTTPEAWDLNALFSRMVAAGCTHVVMEASSQALEQGRLLGLQFALAIFTNLSQDHLDYHGSMEAYFEAKTRLFAQCDAMLVNYDDEWGRQLLSISNCPHKCTYSTQDTAADFMARNSKLEAGGVRFGFLGENFLERVTFPMPGDYSIYNALAAGGAAVLLGHECAEVSAALARCKGVKGRCEVLYSKEFTIIRDFAHTGDAMEKLLKALRPFAENRMIVLFGCAGDRDAAKRPAMGQAAACYGDEIFITADNPRTESIDKTMEDAMGPIRESGKSFVKETIRENAIEMALDTLVKGDMLVLCSKGHEDYQVMNGYTQYLDEAEIVSQWLQKRKYTT